ncbi:DEAD/DEAH box helicase family protein [Cryptosporidium muris RN66]|uniref:RNA helicase n=1 Tax=Cryptosporidium muris (strain RN66) TaxID=441375 RepID=B6AIR3_CRYMR|nr:DEAD/DEAH box helicase family protein [Cryptosporidium muris RN66]EEA08104.1 DEAD/DEAH box helicase family protein [Cryptosporidium muris RN66]|eukprot:XP_002142453.1 DEAD/DEAH box helicase family protein [Cryptosporidium muris RN66]
MMTFSDFSGNILDRRIVQALNSQGFVYPTKVQSDAIGLVIEGKDVLINSKTGSGKTLAFIIPICHNLLSNQNSGSRMKVLILVPSRELVNQVYDVLLSVIRYCGNKIRISHLISENSSWSYISKCNIVISTPYDIVNSSDQDKKVKWLCNVSCLVVDEADLLFAFGYEKYMEIILELLPNSAGKKYQCIFCSATLSKNLKLLNSKLLHKPICVNEISQANEKSVLDKSSIEGILKEYYVNCSNITEKWLMLYVLFKMQVIPIKCLIFASSIDMAYSIRLFLDKFDISAGIMSPILPFSTRQLIIQYFNQGTIDILITADITNELDEISTKDILSSAKSKEAVAYRGIDYQGVSSVLNFDCPTSVRSYIHRIGRTARGNSSGTAITFINKDIPNDVELLQLLIARNKYNDDKGIEPLDFGPHDVSCFNYRIEDCLKSITKTNIRRYKLKEIQGLILSSSRLIKGGYFSKHPEERSVLRSYHKHLLSTLAISGTGREYLKLTPRYLEEIVYPIVQSIQPNCNATTATEQAIYTQFPEALRKKEPRYKLSRYDNLHKYNTQSKDISRKSQLKKEPTYETSTPDTLPAISGRKIWKLKHKKPLQRCSYIDTSKKKRNRR